MPQQPLAKITPVKRAVARTAASAPLSRRHKAAIVVRFLLSEGADVPLIELPDDLQQTLTQAMGQLRYIDRDTLGAVVGEFAAELERVGMSFPDGLAGALEALDGRISPETAARLRREAGVRQKGDPWARLSALDLDALRDIIARESREVSAVVLSKLPVDKAAALLGQLPGDQARRIAFAVAQTERVTPEAVYRIGLSLATQLDNAPPRAFDAPPEKRLGEILDVSPSATRDSVLEGIAEDDAAFARALRGAILTFADLPQRLKPLDAPAVARAAGEADLAIAIAGATQPADQATCEFFLSNMPKRLADQLRETATETAPPDQSAAEAAMARIIQALRQMQAADAITLLPAASTTASDASAGTATTTATSADTATAPENAP